MPLQDKNINHFYRVLSENLPGMDIIVVDLRLDIILVLGNELKKRGWMKKAVMEGGIMDALLPAINTLMEPLWKVAKEGTQVSTEFARDDNYYTLQIIPMQQEGTLTYGYLVIFQNITEAKIRETQLHLSKDAAEEANQAKSNFIANMSHEIRTPLNAIIGFSEQLSKTKLNKKQSHYLEIIQNSSRHLGIIIDDILTISRFEAMEMHIDEVPFKLDRLFEEVEKVVAFRFSEKKVEYYHFLDPALETVFLGDPTKIRQVLINIVTNAIKFTDEGSVVLRCIFEGPRKGRSLVRFEVTDTGIGIPKDKINDIFKPFHQVDSAITRKYKGTGLGLTISKKMVEALGGKIKVSSQPGKGTTFFFSIPLLPSEAALSVLPGKSEKPLVRSVCEGKKVLLVDDDAVNRLLGNIILKEAGIRPKLAVNGSDALKKFKPGRFDLILLDIQMPEISGVDVAVSIRQKEKGTGQRVKILAMTANVLRKDLEHYLANGFDDFLLKPFTEQSLHTKLRQHLAGEDLATGENAEVALAKTRMGDNVHLENLVSVTKGDTGFMLLMIDTFIDNSEEHYQLIKAALDQEDFQRIGELAHKLIPSFKHLNLLSAADQLGMLEIRLLREKNFITARRDVEEVLQSISKSIYKIKKIKIRLSGQ